MKTLSIQLPDKVAARLAERAGIIGVDVNGFIGDVVVKAEAELPPMSLVRLFGSAPDFELRTRSEPWSKRDDQD